MRIEINAGGVDSLFGIGKFQADMSDFITDTESVISGFKAVRKKVYDLNGGVGNLQTAVDELSCRISREEEKADAEERVTEHIHDFMDMTVRTDRNVAQMVTSNRDQFYAVHPWLRPIGVVPEDSPWYEKAWAWMCEKGQQLDHAAEQAWSNIKETASRAWDGLTEFYQEHKKVIDTVLIVAGAVAAIAAVIATGGLALAPLLGALGVSAALATTISTAVAVTAVISTVAASALNITDIWMEIDNPTFNAWQKGLNIISTLSNLTYSVGNLYNSIKHINPRDYVASHQKPIVQTAEVFDDRIPVAQDRFNGERYFAKGDHYDEFTDLWEHQQDYTYTKAENPIVKKVRAKDIEGVFLSDTEVQNPNAFWNKRYSRAGYADYIKNGGMNNNPVEVTVVNDKFYYFSGDGRHRILTAQDLDIDIPVIIKGFYNN